MKTSESSYNKNIIHRTNSKNLGKKSIANYIALTNSNSFYVNPLMQEIHHAKLFQPENTNTQSFSISNNPSYYNVYRYKSNKFINYNEYSTPINTTSKKKLIEGFGSIRQKLLNEEKISREKLIIEQNNKQNLKAKNCVLSSKKKIMTKPKLNIVNNNFENLYNNNNKSYRNLKPNTINNSNKKNNIDVNKNIIYKNKNTEEIKDNNNINNNNNYEIKRCYTSREIKEFKSQSVVRMLIIGQAPEKDKNNLNENLNKKSIEQNKELEKKIKQLEEENKTLKMKCKTDNELENKYKELQNIIEMLMKLEKIKNKTKNLIVNNKLLIDNFKNFILNNDLYNDNSLDYIKITIKAVYLKYLHLKKIVKQNIILNLYFN